MPRKKLRFCWSAPILAVLLAAAASCQKTSDAKIIAHTVELSIAENSYGEYMALEQRAEREFTRTTGIHVRSIVGNENTSSVVSEQLEWLRAGATSPDVYNVDNVFTGTISPYLVDLTPYISSQRIAEYIPEILSAYRVENRQVALPVKTNFPFLYYRVDLLEKYGYANPPRTWDELEQMAATIQRGERKSGNPNFWGFLWEGAANETLTCVAQEFQFSSGGGRIVEPDGSVSVNNARAARAFARAARWINTISPPGTPAYYEEDVRNVWEIGNAAFARNWGEAYASAQLKGSRIRGKVGAAILPHDPGFLSASTVGGMGYGVSKFSQHPREAAMLVQALADRTREIWHVQEYSELPAMANLYVDPAMQPSLAYMEPIRVQLFRSALARPALIAGSRYTEVSHAYALRVHSILTRQATASEALAALEKELVRITGGKVSAPAAAPS